MSTISRSTQEETCPTCLGIKLPCPTCPNNIEINTGIPFGFAVSIKKSPVSSQFVYFKQLVTGTNLCAETDFNCRKCREKKSYKKVKNGKYELYLVCEQCLRQSTTRSLVKNNDLLK